MKSWTDTPTKAHKSIGDSLQVVDNLLSFAKGGKGKPSDEERAVFAAAVVFTYGVWESFVEQLAIELTTNMAKDVAPEYVPEQIVDMFQKNKTAWELMVTPGWRALWCDYVRRKAIGNGENEFGMNTAKAGQVKSLLAYAGVDDPYQGIDSTIVPDHLPPEKKSIDEAINALTELRGGIVHTGKIPGSLRKGQVLEWRQFVCEIAKKIDETCRKQCKIRLSTKAK
jgi:hypothetical protein